MRSDRSLASGLPARPRSWLLQTTEAPWNYAAGFVTDALVALSLLTFGFVTLERPGAAWPVAVSALISYTLYEYLAHRFVFHGGTWAPRVVREGHGSHHREPLARFGMPFWASVPQGAVLVTLAAAVLGLSRGALFTGFFGLGYVAYGWVHHLVHTPTVTWAPVPWLRAVHDVHHTRPGYNFGVSTPLWDFVFRTWSAPERGRPR